MNKSTTQTLQKKLSKITTDILSPGSSEKKLSKNINLIIKFYNTVLEGYDINDLQNQKETSTYKGIALNPQDAANCLQDVKRTVKFIRGIDKAVKVLQQQFKDEKIHIIYAGCGPLVTLILPLCSVWDSRSVKITFIDIHQASLNCAKYIITKSGYEKFVNDYVCCDAAKYRYSKNEPIHLVISETMTSALYKEAQVAIAHNLGLQLGDKGILIPEEIKIRAVLTNPLYEFDSRKRNKFLLKKKRHDFNKYRIALGDVYLLNLENIKNNKSFFSEGSFEMPEKLPAAKISMPDNIKPCYSFMLCTEIKIFDDIIIHEYESGLTCPVNFPFTEHFNELEALEFFYELSDVPSFKYYPVLKSRNK